MGSEHRRARWYESTVEDRVWLIVWDLDHTFEEPSPIRTGYGMPDRDDTGAGCEPIAIFAASKVGRRRAIRSSAGSRPSCATLREIVEAKRAHVADKL